MRIVGYYNPVTREHLYRTEKPPYKPLVATAGVYSKTVLEEGDRALCRAVMDALREEMGGEFDRSGWALLVPPPEAVVPDHTAPAIAAGDPSDAPSEGTAQLF